MQDSGISLEELSNLRYFGHRISKCNTFSEVIEETFNKIEEKLNPQVVSLFLLSKNGLIERYSFRAVDKHGKLIDFEAMEYSKKWPICERYEPGDGFSGKAAKPKDPTVYPYGEIYRQSNITETNLDKLEYTEGYIETIGELKCGISVPLNVGNEVKTLGTIEVINKKKSSILVERKNNNLRVIEFSEADAVWLSLVGSQVSDAISSFLSQEKEDIYANIISEIVDSENSTTDPQTVYRNITNKLVEHEFLPYKACILRAVSGNNLYVINDRPCTSDINWEEKGNSPRPIDNKYIVGETCLTGKPIIVEDIEKEIARFESRKWIDGNHLKSFICYPLSTKGKVVGTMSLFTGALHNFSERECKFLDNISNLIVAYIVKERFSEEKEIPKESYQVPGKTENTTTILPEEKKPTPGVFSISEIEQRYQGQWVTIEVTEVIKGFPKSGKVIFNSQKIEEIEDKISDFKGDLYTFYCGNLKKE
jgi:GAF domain-containing protein